MNSPVNGPMNFNIGGGNYGGEECEGCVGISGCAMVKTIVLVVVLLVLVDLLVPWCMVIVVIRV